MTLGAATSAANRPPRPHPPLCRWYPQPRLVRNRQGQCAETSAQSLGPPAVNPVLPCQHAFRAERPDRKIARKRERPTEMIDSALLPRGPLHPPHARLARTAVLSQRVCDACGALGELKA